jgi:hypothetical protein
MLIPLLFALLTVQTEQIPDLRLSLAFRESVAGRFQSAVYLLEVNCEDNECAFTYVSLNDCRGQVIGRETFYAKVESRSTLLGNLKARHDGTVLTLEETGTDSYGNWTNTFRIGYQPTTDGSVATRVVSFSGEFVKTSELLRNPQVIEYIPLSSQTLRLDCPVLLPGVDRN